MAWLMTGATVVSAGTAVAGTIAGTRDARLRTQYEQQLSLLDYDQKKQLNDTLLKANSEQARQQILANALGGVSQARVQTFGNIALEREKTNQVVTILGVIAGIGLLGFLLLTLTRKK
jgi:hypothetical protein